MFGYKNRGAVEIITGPEGEVQHDVKQCCHCGGYWRRVIGSGAIRGHCTKCNADFCGPNCIVCIPYEKQLEMIEAGQELQLELKKLGI